MLILPGNYLDVINKILKESNIKNKQNFSKTEIAYPSLTIRMKVIKLKRCIDLQYSDKETNNCQLSVTIHNL